MYDITEEGKSGWMVENSSWSCRREKFPRLYAIRPSLYQSFSHFKAGNWELWQPHILGLKRSLASESFEQRVRRYLLQEGKKELQELKHMLTHTSVPLNSAPSLTVPRNKYLLRGETNCRWNFNCICRHGDNDCQKASKNPYNWCKSKKK